MFAWNREKKDWKLKAKKIFQELPNRDLKKEKKKCRTRLINKMKELFLSKYRQENNSSSCPLF